MALHLVGFVQWSMKSASKSVTDNDALNFNEMWQLLLATIPTKGDTGD